MITTKDRLKAFLTFKKIGRNKFEEMINVSTGYMSSKGVNIASDALERTCFLFPELNTEWLVTGKGEMIKGDKAVSTIAPKHIIKYFPSVNGSMGGVEFLDSPDETPTDIVIPGFSECRFAINACGDSMYPVIKSGQIVVMMQWTERFIDWGRIYMVVTKSGYRTIKYLKPSSEDGCISCESENKGDNPPFNIEMNDIHKLYLVKGWICRDAI